MPPRKPSGADADAGTQPTRAAASRTTSRTASRGRAATSPPDALKTFADFVGTRPFEPTGPADEKLQGRSFQLPVGVVERTRAAASGVEHRAYGTDLEDQVPGSVSAFVTEALMAACTYYENLFNGGQEFRRVHRLSPGPSKEGAQRGAEKRAAIRAAKEGGTE